MKTLVSKVYNGKDFLFPFTCDTSDDSVSAHVQDLGRKNKYCLRYTNYQTKDEKQEVSFALDDADVPNTGLWHDTSAHVSRAKQDAHQSPNIDLEIHCLYRKKLAWQCAKFGTIQSTCLYLSRQKLILWDL